ncbi:MAG TPA: hypothetical protein EYG68_11695, partial [Leucothrix mucor]|nr:hypothetical protein [Leucothrix mucor]
FFQSDLGEAALINPTGAIAGSERVMRGGGWLNYGGSVRSAMRADHSPDDRSYDIGLRLVVGQSSTSLQNPSF